mgnify:CR=1 FL=1
MLNAKAQYSACVNHASHIKVVGVNDRGYRVGASNPKAKLTQAMVDEMRDLHEDKHVGYRRLARMFGVPRGTVQHVCNYTSWQTPTSFRKVVVQKEPVMYETERGGPLQCKPVDESGKSDD